MVVGYNLPEGYYTVVVNDVDDASNVVAQTSKVIRLKYVKNLGLLETIVDEQCYGANDGSITVTVLNNGAPSYEHYTYEWSGSEDALGTDAKIANLKPGEYFVTVTDDEGCSFTSSKGYVVSPATALGYQLESLPAIDCEDYKRAVRVLTTKGTEPAYGSNPLGGSESYRFTWSGPAPVTRVTADETITLHDGTVVTLHPGDIKDLTKGGIYKVTMTDANGCKLSKEVYVPVEIQVEKVTVTPLSCSGGYYVDSDYKKVDPQPTGADVNNYTYIPSSQDGAIEVTLVEGSEVVSYNWYRNTTASGVDAPDKTGTSLATANELKGMEAGKYWMEVVAGSCTKDLGPFEITQTESPLYLKATPSNIVSCVNSSTGRITVEVKGGTAPYEIYFIDGMTNSTYMSYNGYYLFQNLKAATGLYRLRVTDAKGCTYPSDGSFVPVDVKQPGALSITLDRYQMNCADDKAEVDFYISGGVEKQNTSGDYYRYYQIVLTGEGDASYKTQMEESLVTHDANGETEEPNGGRGEKISWTDLKPGKYVLTVSDYNSEGYCSVMREFEIEDLKINTLELSNPSCESNAADGSIVVEATGNSGDLTYEWYYDANAYPDPEAGATPIASLTNKVTLTNLGIGYYVLKVTDSGIDAEGGKVDGKNYRYERYQLDNSQTITFGTASIKHQTCAGSIYDGAIAPVVVTADGSELTYAWTGPAGFSATTKNISGLRPGIYYLTVTDATGCFKRASFEVEAAQPINFYLEMAGDVCDVNDRRVLVKYKDENGVEHAGVSGGTPSTVTGYSFEWVGESQPTWDAVNYVATGLVEGGVYTVYVRDANMCLAQASTPDLHSEVDVTAAVTDIKCHGGNNGMIDPTITKGMGNYKYRWYKDVSSGLSALRTEIGTTVDPTTVTTGHELTAGSSVVTTRVASSLTAGTYYLIVTDFENADYTGCLHNSYYTWEVSEPVELKATATPVPTTCNGYADGVVTVDVTGGVAPYEYEWNLGSETKITDTPKLSGLKAGTYFVVVRDANGCSAQTSATVADASSLDFDFDVTDVNCNGENGRLEIRFADGSVVPGQDGVVLYWNGPSIDPSQTQNILVQSNLRYGLYTVAVTRSGGCVVQRQHSFVEPMKIEEATVTANRCSGSKTGSIVLQVSGGSGDYAYEWSAYEDANKTTEMAHSGIDNANGFYQAGLSSGYFFVKVIDKARTDQAGTAHCELEGGPYYVSNAMELKVVATNGRETCVGSNDGSISVSVSGGSGNYSYQWFGNGTGLVDGAKDQVSLSAGSYQVVVTDLVNGCSASQSPIVDGSTEQLQILLDGVSNVSCYDGRDGEVRINVIGGTPFTKPDPDDPAQTVDYYNIKWASEGSQRQEISSTLTGLKAGKYYVTVEDHFGCMVEDYIDVTENDKLTASEAVTNVVKVGESTGGIRITAIDGGVYPYKQEWFAWDGSAFASLGAAAENNLEISNKPAGLYKYVVTDKNGCEYEKEIIISDNGALDVKIVKKSDVLCSGESTGGITIQIYNGQAPYTVTENGTVVLTVDSPGIYELTGRRAGIYTIVVTDGTGSQFKERIEILQPVNALALTAVEADKQCAGVNNGTIHIEISGGTPLQAAADDAQWGISAGDYYYDVYMNGTILAKVDDNAPADGRFTATYDITGRPTGTYRVSVEDANGCSQAAQVRITEHSAITVDLLSLEDVKCRGNASGSIEIKEAGTAAPVYHWTSEPLNATTATVPTDVAAQDSPKLINLTAGIYKLTVEDAGTGCRSEEYTYTVSEPDELTASLTPKHVTTCHGNADGQITIYVKGGVRPYSVRFYDTQKADEATTVEMTTGSYTFANLTGGTRYKAEVTDANGCVHRVLEQELTQPAVLAISDLTAGIGCEDSDGLMTMSITGGLVVGDQNRYAIELSGVVNDSKIVTFAADESQRTVTFDNAGSGLPEGLYVVAVTDLNSSSLDKCAVSETFTISNMHITSTVTQPTCDGINDGSVVIAVDGAVGELSYLWEASLDGGTTWSDLGNGSTLQNATSLSEGKYRVTVTDAGRSGCNVQRTYDLKYTKTLEVSAAVTHEQCAGANDGTITKLLLTGFTEPADVTYLWSGVGIDASNFNKSELTGLAPGTYTLVLTDNADGCSIRKTFEIEEADAQMRVELDDTMTDCHYNHTIKARVYGGTRSYRYMISGPLSALTFDTGSPVLVADPNTGEEYFEYTLSNVTRGGTYSFTFTDTHNCSVTATIDLESELAFVENDIEVVNVDCHGGDQGAINIGVEGGSRAYTYAWTKDGDDAWTATTPGVANLSAGTYQVVVSDGTCSIERKFTITEPTEISIVLNPTDITCYGDANGSISATVSGGVSPYTYKWSNNATTRTIGGLEKGTYTVYVTDANGCMASQSAEVKEPAEISFDLVMAKDVDCTTGLNGELRIENIRGGWGADASGNGGQLTYVWSGEAIDASGLRDQMTATGLSAVHNGIYSVTVSDKSAGRSKCWLTKTYEFATPMKITAIPHDETCEGQMDGSIAVSVTGGVAPYSYQWTTTDGRGYAETTASQSGLTAGTYRLTVTDSRIAPDGTPNACVAEATVVIGRQYNLVVDEVVTDVKCYGESTGSIVLNVSGGSGSYSYRWSGPSASLVSNSPTQTALAQGDYTVTVTDNLYGCEATKTYKVKAPDSLLKIGSVAITDVLCYGDNTGRISVGVTGGTKSGADYTYHWSGSNAAFANAGVADNLYAGTYNLTVIDDNGCQVSTGDLVVTQPDEPLAITVRKVVNVMSKGAATGEITISVTGGYGNYHYEWTSLADGSAFGLDKTHVATLKAGDYKVKVTDENGCEVESQIIHITEPDEELVARIVGTNILPCHGDANGMIDIDVSGGAIPYTITCTNDQGIVVGEVSGETSLNLTGLTPGWYMVDVVDANKVTAACTVYNNATSQYESGNYVLITEPEELVMTKADRKDVGCHDAATGSFKVKVTGGVKHGGRYRVEVSGTNNFNDIGTVEDEKEYTGLKSGIYTIRLIDDSNADGKYDYNTDCWIADTIIIRQPAAHLDLSLVDGSGSYYICEGSEADLKIVTSNWDLAAKPLKAVIRRDNDVTTDMTVDVTATPQIVKVTPLETSAYNIVAVYAYDPDCSQGTFGTKAAIVPVRPRPTSYIYGDNSLCYGGTATVSIDLTPASGAPWSFVVTDGTMNFNLTSDKTPYVFEYTPEAPGTVSLNVISVSDSYCAATDADLKGTATIVTHDLPRVTMAGTRTICQGQKTDLTFSIKGGTAPYTLSYYYLLDGVEMTRTIANIGEDQKVTDPVTGEETYVATQTVSPAATTDFYLRSVVDAHGCTPETVDAMATVAIMPLPGTPLKIKGADIVCQGESGVVYSIEPVEYATGYEWVLPQGMTIMSGDGSKSITVDIDRTFEGGTLRVRSLNDCEGSDYRDKLISVNHLPVAPGTIVSQPDYCQGQTGIRISVPTIKYATTYEWDLPAGFSIVSGDETATIIVEVAETQSFVNGTIRVRGVNSCGEGEWSAGNPVTVHPLPQTISAGADANACGSTTTLSGSWDEATATGLWEILRGGSQFASGADPTAKTVDIENLSQGDNRFRLTVTTSYGCTVSDEVTVRNNQLNVTARSIQTLICDGNAQLQGFNLPAGCSGIWTVEEGSAEIDNASAAYVNVTNMSQGKSVFKWTIDQYGCKSSASVAVVNSQPDAPAVTIVDGTSRVTVTEEEYLTKGTYRYVICDTDITLEGIAVSTAVFPNQESVWERVSGGGQIAPSTASQTIQLTGLTQGDNIYRYTVTTGNCSRSILVNIYNAQLRVNAGNDIPSTCDDYAVLDASTLPNANCLGYWTTVEGRVTYEDSSDPKTKITGIRRGRNVLRWTVNQEGCESSDEVVVVSNKVTVATTQAALTVCDGATAFTGNTFDANYETGTWKILEGYADIEDIHNPNSTASNFDRGRNVMRWLITSNEGGCSSYADQLVFNNAIDVNAGNDTSICTTQTTIRAITPRTDGKWTVKAGHGYGVITNPDNYSTQVGGLVYGANVFVWTVTKDGCSSSDEVTVYNNSPKLVDQNATNIAGPDQNNLVNPTTTMAAVGVVDGYGEGTWQLKFGGCDPIAEPHNPQAIITGLGQGTNTFIWRVENKGCVVTDEVDITYGSVTPAEAGDNVYNLCNDKYELQANGPFNGVGKWTLVYGSGTFDDMYSAKTMVRGLDKGRNTFRWTITYTSGSTSDTVQVWNMQVTEAYAGKDRVLCADSYELQGNKYSEGDNRIEMPDGSITEVKTHQMWEVISGHGEWFKEAQKEGNRIDKPQTLTTPIVSNLKQGKNVFVYQITNDICSSFDTVVIVNDMADKAYACGAGVTKCDTVYSCDGTARLYPNSPTYGTGSWRVVGGSKATFEDNDVYNLGQGVNELIWEITTESGGECNSYDTVVVVNNEASVADAGIDRPVCGSNFVLSAGSPKYGEGTWELISGGGQFVDPVTGDTTNISHNANTDVVGLSFGENRFRWTVNNHGCTTIDEVVLDNIYIQAKAGAVAPLCVDTVQLNANNPNPGVGMWSVAPGGGRAVFDDNNLQNTVVRDLAKGSNYLVWTINYMDCPSSDTVVVVNNKPTTAYAGAEQTLCEENTTVLQANELSDSYESGHWSVTHGGGNILYPDQATTVVKDVPFSKDGNIYQWTVVRTYDGFSCFSVSDVTVYYNKIEADAGSDQRSCSDSVRLQANNPGIGIGTWTAVGSTGAGLFGDRNDPTTVVNSLGKGSNILRWTINYRGCESHDDVEIINGSPSKPYAGSEQPTCDDEITLQAAYPEVGTGVWSTIGGYGSWDANNIYDPHAHLDSIGKGNNTYRWTVTNKTPIPIYGMDGSIMKIDTLYCRDYDDVNIINQKPSEANAGADMPTCSNDYTLKAVTPIYGTGLWTIVSNGAGGGGQIVDPTSPETEVHNLGYGSTTFRWTLSVDGRCADYDDVTISNYTPTTADAGSPKYDCESCQELDANVPIIGSGSWNVISGTIADVSGVQSFENINDPKTTVCNLLFGENKFLWVIENIVTVDGATFRCQSVDTVSIWNMMPDEAIAGDDRTLCKDYYTLNASKPTIGTGAWEVMQGSGTFADATDPKTTVTGLSYGENILRWTVSYGDECKSSDDILLYSQQAEPYAGENDVTYEDSYQLIGGNPGRLSGHWEYLGVASTVEFADSSNYSTMVKGLVPGVNTFRWVIVTDDCRVYDEVSITYKVVPTAGFEANYIEGCVPLTVRFTDQTINGTTYNWDFGDGTQTTVRNPSHT